MQYGVIKKIMAGKKLPWYLCETQWQLVTTFETKERAQAYIDGKDMPMNYQIVEIIVTNTDSKQPITIIL